MPIHGAVADPGKSRLRLGWATSDYIFCPKKAIQFMAWGNKLFKLAYRIGLASTAGAGSTDGHDIWAEHHSLKACL